MSLAAVGLGLGALTSAANHGFLLGEPYAAKVIGNSWAWLAAGWVAAWPGHTWKTAAARAMVLLVAAVGSYYGSDVAAGTYTSELPSRGISFFDAAGLVVDLASYVVISAILSAGLGGLAVARRRGAVLSLAAALAVPGYITWTALHAQAVARQFPPDPAMEVVSVWIAAAALAAAAVSATLTLVRWRPPSS